MSVKPDKELVDGFHALIDAKLRAAIEHAYPPEYYDELATSILGAIGRSAAMVMVSLVVMREEDIDELRELLDWFASQIEEDALAGWHTAQKERGWK